MTQEASVKVALDTEQAKRDLRELGKQGEATARRIDGRSGRGGAGGSLAKGFGLGAGFALGKRVAGSVGVFSAIGDVMENAFSGVTAKVDSAIGAPDARAKKSAREETVQNYALQVGMGSDLSQAKSFYNQVLNLKHRPQQEGAAALNSALGGDTTRKKGEDKGVFDGFIDTIVGSIDSGFELLRSVISG